MHLLNRGEAARNGINLYAADRVNCIVCKKTKQTFDILCPQAVAVAYRKIADGVAVRSSRTNSSVVFMINPQTIFRDS